MTSRMNWTCPICGRGFARIHQFHNCTLYSIPNHHLAKANPATHALYEELIKNISSFGVFSIEPLKSIIALKKRTQFCSIQVQEKGLKIQFRNYTPFQSARFKRISQQANMFYYEFLLKDVEELDEDVITWLRTAYDEN